MKKVKVIEEVKKVFESQFSFRILCAVGMAIIALLIFLAGVTVGFHKASFGRAWGENYNQNFGIRARSPYGMRMGGIDMMDYLPNAHGAVGKIIKVAMPNIIVQDDDNTEKVVYVSSNTKIEQAGAEATINDLKIDNFVVVIGSPNAKGVIEAKFIRLIPNPELLH